ncbi:MAG: hypothetical protein CVU39_14585 [Chloroflexi bacterium HGW-Chloroflexi-10]|nr:MAG: hypothetical protein CVU39_14585 [Chloroflexi bacterium HGW-Chloroflexi-10]
MTTIEISDLKQNIESEIQPVKKLELLLALAKKLQNSDLTQAILVADDAVLLAEHLQAEQKNVAELLVQGLFTRAYLNTQTANYSLAISSIYQALAYFGRFQNERLRGRCVNILALANFYLGNSAEGFHFSWQALEIFEQCEDRLWEASIYNNLGYQYLSMENFEWAERYFFQALEKLKNLSSDKEQADIYDNLCVLYTQTGEWEKALDNGKKAVFLYRKSGETYNLVEALNNLGRYFQEHKEYNLARASFEEALAISRHCNLRYQEVRTLLFMGSATMEHHFVEEAALMLQEALDIADSVGAKRESYKIHRLLARAYKQTGDFALSLGHFEHFYRVEKQVNNEKEIQRIKSLEIIHQVENARRDVETFRIQNQTLQEQLVEQERQRVDLEQQAITDPLTGLLNRRHFSSMVANELLQAAQYGKAVSMIVMDVDHFKMVNDSYGHLVGDQVLSSLAHILRQELRQRDVVWRYGGEEFVILLPHTGCEHARMVADRLREQVADHVFLAGRQQVQITISMGVACSAGQSDMIVESLFDRADKALFVSKQKGRNLVSTWEDPSFTVE